MAVFCYFLSLIFLVWIAFQDFRERMVYWVLFPLAAISLGVYSYVNYLNLGKDILVNFLYLIVLGFIVIGYLHIKGNRIGDIFSKFLGIGDLLFFGVLAVALPTLVFALFFVLSLLLSLGLGLTVFKGSTIPLAGCQAILLGGLLSLFHFKIITVWDIEQLLL